MLEDKQTALHADIEDVILATTLAECVGQLETRFPASDSRLSRLAVVHGYYDHERSQYQRRDAIIVGTPDRQRYAGGSVPEAMQLAKEFGSIMCSSLSYYRIKKEATAEGSLEAIHKEGFKLLGQHTVLVQLVYCPKAIQRAAKARATREARRTVRCRDISGATWPMFQLVREHLPNLVLHTGNYSRQSVCSDLILTIKYFTFVFGHHAYRRHPAFRELKMLWRAAPERARVAWWPKEDQDWGKPQQQQVCNFMDSEIRIKNGKLIEENDNWQAKRTSQPWETYGEKEYRRTFAANCKQDAKEAREKEKARKARDKAKAKEKGSKAKPRAKAKSR